MNCSWPASESLSRRKSAAPRNIQEDFADEPDSLNFRANIISPWNFKKVLRTFLQLKFRHAVVTARVPDIQGPFSRFFPCLSEETPAVAQKRRALYRKRGLREPCPPTGLPPPSPPGVR